MLKKLLLIALALIVIVTLGLIVGVRMLLSPERVRSAVEAQASAALGMPVKVASATARIWPRPGLTLTDFVAGEPAQVSMKRVELSTGLRPLLSRRVEDAEVVIEQSRLDLPKLLATIEALSRTAPPPGGAETGGSGGGVTIVNVKTIGLRDVELVAGSRAAVVNLSSSIDGDRLEIARLSARADQSALEATGAIESLSRRIVRLAITAEQLDLDGFLQFASALASGTPTTKPAASSASAARASRANAAAASGAALDFRATIKAAKGSLLGLAFTSLETTVAVTPQQVMLTPLAFGTFGGRVTGDIGVTLAGAQPELTVTSTFDGLDLQQVAAFAGSPSAVTGTLGGRVHVTGRGLDAASALATATGTGDVTLAKGRLPGLQLVRPAVTLFAGRTQPGTAAAPAEGSGESFDRISATLAIGGGQVRTDDLRFESRDVDMQGTGTLGIAGGSSGAVSVKADLRLSEELSNQAGRDLVRYAHEGHRVVLPATISGTVASPRVMIDVQQAAGRALKNEVQERAKSLFERLIPGQSKPKPKTP